MKFLNTTDPMVDNNKMPENIWVSELFEESKTFVNAEDVYNYTVTFPTELSNIKQLWYKKKTRISNSPLKPFTISLNFDGDIINGSKGSSYQEDSLGVFPYYIESNAFSNFSAGDSQDWSGMLNKYFFEPRFSSYVQYPKPLWTHRYNEYGTVRGEITSVTNNSISFRLTASKGTSSAICYYAFKMQLIAFY